MLQVDDVHELDTASAEYLSDLARFHGVRLVLTSRLTPPPHPAVTELWKDGFLERIDLPRLPPEALLQLAATHTSATRTTPATLEPDTAQRLVAHAQGNPMHLLALIDTLTTAGELREHRDLLVWQGGFPRHGSIVDVIRPEIDRLTPQTRLAFDAVALLGPLQRDLITDLTSPDALDQLERTDLVEREPAADRTRPALRVAHPLYGEVARTMMTAAATRALYARAAASAAPRATHDPALAVRVVRWSLEAGEIPDAALVAGLADAATNALDVEHAVDLETARILLSSTDPTAETPTHLSARGRAYAARATAYRLLGRLDDAQADALAARKIADHLTGLERADLLSRAAVAQSEVAMVRTGNAATMSAILDEARGEMTDYPELAVGLELQAAGKLAYAGQLRASFDRFEALIDHVPLDSRLLPAYGLTAVMVGWVGRGHEVVHRYLREASEPSRFDPDMLGSAMANLVGMGIAAGLVDEAAASLAHLHGGIPPTATRAEVQPLLALDAIVAIAQGRWADAELAARSASAQFDSLDGAGLLRLSLAALALTLAAQGQREDASRIRAEAARVAARSNGVVEPLAAVMLLHAGLWLREATIAQECETVAHVLTERGATLGVVRALHARSLASPDGPAIVIDRTRRCHHHPLHAKTHPLPRPHRQRGSRPHHRLRRPRPQPLGPLSPRTRPCHPWCLIQGHPPARLADCRPVRAVHHHHLGTCDRHRCRLRRVAPLRHRRHRRRPGPRPTVLPHASHPTRRHRLLHFHREPRPFHHRRQGKVRPYRPVRRSPTPIPR